MFKLNNLVKLTKKRKRVGRGGKLGGTAGKGHKGQKARTSGTVPAGFEGGQMPISRRIPKRGFNNKNFRQNFEIVSLERLDKIFVDGDHVTKDLLIEKNIIKKKQKVLVKILGNKITKKLTISANAFSKSAIDAINNVGGKTEVIK